MQFNRSQICSKCFSSCFSGFSNYTCDSDDIKGMPFASFLQAGGGGAGGKVAKVEELDRIDIKKEAEAGRVSLRN